MTLRKEYHRIRIFIPVVLIQLYITRMLYCISLRFKMFTSSNICLESIFYGTWTNYGSHLSNCEMPFVFTSWGSPTHLQRVFSKENIVHLLGSFQSMKNRIRGQGVTKYVISHLIRDWDLNTLTDYVIV